MIEHELPFCAQSFGDNPGLPRQLRTLHKGSKSSSKQATNNTDNSAVVSDEATNIAGNSNSTINIQRIDSQVVSEVADVAIEAINENGNVIDAALDFGDDALSTVENTVDRAFDFGEDAISANAQVIDRGFDFGREALDFVEGSDERNANIINAATAGIRGVTEKVVEGLFSDRADTRESEGNSLLETLGKYSSIMFVGGAAAAAYAIAKRN